VTNRRIDGVARVSALTATHSLCTVHCAVTHSLLFTDNNNRRTVLTTRSRWSQSVLEL